jgi:hypothetical protein
MRKHGRAALLSRGSAAKCTQQQPAGFSIRCIGSELTAANVRCDVFQAQRASSRFPDTWALELAANGFDVEHGNATFFVFVPHSYYTKRSWFCMSVDRSCVLNVLVYALVIGVLLRLAYMIGM